MLRQGLGEVMALEIEFLELDREQSLALWVSRLRPSEQFDHADSIDVTAQAVNALATCSQPFRCLCRKGFSSVSPLSSPFGGGLSNCCSLLPASASISFLRFHSRRWFRAGAKVLLRAHDENLPVFFVGDRVLTRHTFPLFPESCTVAR